MKYIQMFICSTLATSLSLSGCATKALMEKSKTDYHFTEKQVLNEQVIAVGVPKTPIPNHPYAMILEGKQYSFLVEPSNIHYNKPDLFYTIFNQVDLSAIYVDTRNDRQRTIEDLQASDKQQLKVNLWSGQTDLSKFSQYFKLMFVKQKSKLKANEQANLEKLGFMCDEDRATDDKKDILICRLQTKADFTVATPVNNLENVKYKLKEPLIINVTQDVEHTDKSKQSLKVFTPLTIAVDLVTLPLQVVTYGVFSWLSKSIHIPW